ncbi:MAG: GNAT family N-acetyltransferase [Actinobacteria bacterium]|nr:GNAT family N-acetyltransferase [Actinomycetota bacterium]
MNGFDRLDVGDLEAIAHLCARGIVDSPTSDELRVSLFAPDQPAVVRGDPNVGVVATVVGDDAAHIRLLVVDPAHRGRGIGHDLVRAAEADATGLGRTALITGADAPYFLWPGVPTSETALCALFERHHYARTETNYDVRIELDLALDDPGGARLAGAADAAAIDAFMRRHWDSWRLEVERALGKGNLMIAEDAGGISAFCAFEVNRRGFLGPVAVRPDLIGRGAGQAALLAALRELRRRGRTWVDVSWVGPIVPYARLGGRIHTTYFVYRRDLPVTVAPPDTVPR